MKVPKDRSDKARNRPSIQTKFTSAILSMSLLALALATAGFLGYEVIDFRRSLVMELTTLANTLGANTAASLGFGDPKSGAEMLKALRAGHQIVAACLYDAEGTVFATYIRGDGLQKCPASPDSRNGTRFVNGLIVLQQDVPLNSEIVGRIQIISDLSLLRAKVLRLSAITLVVLVASIATTFIVSARVARAITMRIVRLSELTRAVSERQDYTLRAEEDQEDDEASRLQRDFNKMVVGIHARDVALQEANDELEVRVRERTA